MNLKNLHLSFMIYIASLMLLFCGIASADVVYRPVNVFSWVHEWRADTDTSLYLYTITIEDEIIFSTSERSEEGKFTTWMKVLAEEGIKNGSLGYAVSYGAEFPGGFSSAHRLKREVTDFEPIVNPEWKSNVCTILVVTFANGSKALVEIIRRSYN